jgi:hypothetical protein
MTRKDYIAIAAQLKEACPVIEDGNTLHLRLAQWQKDVVAMATILARDNPRFDHTRFYEACGLND